MRESFTTALKPAYKPECSSQVKNRFLLKLTTLLQSFISALFGFPKRHGIFVS